MKSEFEIQFYIQNNLQNVVFEKKFKNNLFEISTIVNENKIEAKINCFQKIKLKSFRCSIDYIFDCKEQFFANGFQSWTETRQWNANEKIKRFSLFSKIINPLFKLSQYGDTDIFKNKISKGQIYGFDFAYIKNQKRIKLFKSEIPETIYTIFVFNTLENKIDIYFDVEQLEIENNLEIADISIVDTSINELSNIYTKQPIVPITGWTSWYNYYQNINESIIEENFTNFCKFFPNESIFQIDDGYQTAVGDWLSIDYNKFPNGLEPIAEKIHSNGYKAGLWLAPTAAQKKSLIVAQHPQWFLKDNKGKFIYGGSNWGGFYILDIFNEEVQDYLKKVFDTILNKWKFDIVKLDFLYSTAIQPRIGYSRAQIMSKTMEFLRKITGDKKILGCGVPLMQSAYKVDYCRIGADMGLNWNGKLHEKWLHRERVSSLNSLNNTISRYFIDKSFFGNDPDVFIIRNENNHFTYEQKITIYLINAIFGSLVFTSDNLKNYKEWQLKLIENLKFFVNASVLEYTKNNNIYYIDFQIEDKKYKAISNFSNKEQLLDFKISGIFNIFDLNFENKTTDTVKPYETIIYE